MDADGTIFEAPELSEDFETGWKVLKCLTSSQSAAERSRVQVHPCTKACTIKLLLWIFVLKLYSKGRLQTLPGKI
jgi:hypothetical protein